jgi:hypothetical protein
MPTGPKGEKRPADVIGSDPLAGVSEQEREVMSRLLRMPPERQKAAPKPTSAKGEAQRRRRAQERQQPTGANGGG